MPSDKCPWGGEIPTPHLDKVVEVALAGGFPGGHDPYHHLINHPQLHAMPEHHRAVVAQHLQRAAGAAASGDHTTAEMHLADAARRATSQHAGNLTQAIHAQMHVHNTAARAQMGLRPQGHAEFMTGRRPEPGGPAPTSLRHDATVRRPST